MSDQTAYEKLGVTEEASFEEILDAKNRLSQQHNDDVKLVESLEAAYDEIIMDRLKRRQEGRIKVPERIRFPEKSSQAPPSMTPVSLNKSPAWLQQLIDTPSRRDLVWSAGVFSALAAITVLYQSPDGSVVPLVLALGFGANIYFLNRKEQRFGRSVLLTLLGLLVGISLGSVFAGLLSVPLANSGLSVDQFATLLTFVIFWAISSFFALGELKNFQGWWLR